MSKNIDKGRRSPERGPAFSMTKDDVNAGLASVKTGILTVSDVDLRVWELVTDVPALQNIWAYVCFILNVLLPGTGTMLCACLGDKNLNKTQLGTGIVQLLTSVYLIGWLASIYWGYLIVVKSKGDHNEIKQLMSSATGNSGAAQSHQPGSVQMAGQKRPNNPYEDQ